MPDLLARSTVTPDRTWRRPIPDGPVALSRNLVPPDRLPPGAVCWAVEWDQFMSSPHAFLQWADGRLTVRRRMTPTKTTNAVIYAGKEADEFSLVVGESFQIGDTFFTLCVPDDLPPKTAEWTLPNAQLRQIRFADPDRRVEVLAGLPELIRLSASDAELQERVAEVLLEGIPSATVAGLVQLPPEDRGDAAPVVAAVRSRDASRAFTPSRRLLRAALRERRQGVLHAWPPGAGDDGVTRTFGTDWAACVPLLDDQHPDLGLYVAGRLPRQYASAEAALRDPMLRSDLRFAELTADLFSSLRSVRLLQHRNALLARFLSPKVQAAVADRNVDELLRPRPAEVTVLFCDLRGASRFAEAGAADLEATWETVSEALAIMSNAILEYGGVIGDFQGDAALGFWGWPLAEDRQVEWACRAALHVHKRFAQAAQLGGHRLARFSCGIGVAHGPAIAGRIGVPEQYKVGVFGPTVNLASRCESMTRHFGVSVLIDERVARAIGPGSAAGWARVRRVARVRPYGMDLPVGVAELLPPAAESARPTEPQRLDYEAGLDAFQSGRWDAARAKLTPLARAGDGPSRFLTDFMDRHPGGGPPGWDGVIPIDSK
jgi:adenylate cyclase